MSSGDKFLKRTKTDTANQSYEEITLDRSHIVNAVGPYLQSLNIIPDAKDITNIQFSDLFGASTQEFVTLKVFTGGAAK